MLSGKIYFYRSRINGLWRILTINNRTKQQRIAIVRSDLCESYITIRISSQALFKLDISTLSKISQSGTALFSNILFSLRIIFLRQASRMIQCYIVKAITNFMTYIQTTLRIIYMKIYIYIYIYIYMYVCIYYIYIYIYKVSTLWHRFFLFFK